MVFQNYINKRGINAFIDIESMHAGRFDEQIYDRINDCNSFLLILSPNTLDKCINIDDWSRLKIEKALELKKNIVLVIMPNFSFPDTLSASIKNIRYYQGVQSKMEFIIETVNKVVELLEK